MVTSYQTTRSHTQQDCCKNPYCDESLKTTFFFLMCDILAGLHIPQRHCHTDIPLFHQFVKNLLGDGARDFPVLEQTACSYTVLIIS